MGIHRTGTAPGTREALDVSKVTWKNDPDEHDYPAATAYLSLLTSTEVVDRLVADLRQASVQHGKAKDLLRASHLPLLPADNKHVASDLAKVAAGKALSPVLLVRGELREDVALQIADGYHRVCASYHLDENTDIPYQMAVLDQRRPN
jgi:hypothetical protein